MKKILLIEDDSTLRTAYKTILSIAGYEIHEAVDGAHGLEKAKELNPDLIILDMLMPRMTGLEFLRIYNIKTDHPNTKVIVFSNSSMPESVEEAMELGASRYLVKAVMPPEEVIKMVEEVLKTP